jgi:hypothetical protein
MSYFSISFEGSFEGYFDGSFEGYFDGSFDRFDGYFEGFDTFRFIGLNSSRESSSYEYLDIC